MFLKEQGACTPGVFLVSFPVDGLIPFMRFVNLLFDLSCVACLWSGAAVRGGDVELSALGCTEV